MTPEANQGRSDGPGAEYVRQAGFAFQDRADYLNTTPGAGKKLRIPRLRAGPWYIGVECASTVRAEPGEHSHAYGGNLEVLNGVPYSITADWEP